MPFGLAVLAAFVSGMFGVSFAMGWLRAFSFASASAASTAPLVFAAYLIGVGQGGRLAGWLCERYRRPELLRVVACLAMAGSVLGFLVIPSLVRIVWISVWGWALPGVALSAAAFGAIAPIVSHLSIEPNERAGSRLSSIMAATLLGSMVGGLLTGFVLLELMGVHAIMRLLALAGIAGGAGVAIAVTPRREGANWTAVAAGLLLFVGLSHDRLYRKAYERLFYKEHYHADAFERVVENRHGVVAVTASQQVIADGIYDGNASIDVKDVENRVIRAFAVAALHSAPRRVLMIGLGTGAWVQVVAGLPSVEDVVVIDMNPGYQQIISDAPDVAPLLENTKVQLIDGDARRWLARHPDERFDVVVASTGIGWRGGGSALMSVEFMRLVRDRLSSGGVFYFNTMGALDPYRTAFDVFPNGLRFTNFAAVSMSPVEFDIDRWRSALVAYRLNGAALFDTTSEAGLRRLDEFLLAPSDPKGWYGSPMLESRRAMLGRLRDATVITDDNMGSEWKSVYPVGYVP